MRFGIWFFPPVLSTMRTSQVRDHHLKISAPPDLSRAYHAQIWVQEAVNQRGVLAALKIRLPATWGRKEYIARDCRLRADSFGYNAMFGLTVDQKCIIPSKSGPWFRLTLSFVDWDPKTGMVPFSAFGAWLCQEFVLMSQFFSQSLRRILTSSLFFWAEKLECSTLIALGTDLMRREWFPFPKNTFRLTPRQGISRTFSISLSSGGPRKPSSIRQGRKWNEFDPEQNEFLYPLHPPSPSTAINPASGFPLCLH